MECISLPVEGPDTMHKDDQTLVRSVLWLVQLLQKKMDKYYFLKIDIVQNIQP